MARPRIGRHAVLVAFLVFSAIGLAVRAPLAVADPDLADLGNGNKTVAWNFANPAAYTFSNTEIGPDGRLSLRRLGSSWTHTSDNDFSSNGFADPQIVVVDGSLRLRGNEDSLVANGNFSGSENWTFTGSTSGSVAASQGAGTGEFTHSAPNNSSQFDSMDTGAGWQPVSSGIGATSIIATESLIVQEGTGSLKNTVSLDSSAKWAGIQTPPSAWNFQPYNEFSVWLNGNAPGLSVILNLRTASAEWNSDPAPVPSAWQLVRFNISSFGGNLGSIIQVQLRFTGAVVPVGDIYIDDLWRRYFKSLDESARIDQAFTKSTENFGKLGSAVLRWDTDVPAITNVVETRLRMAVEHEGGAATSWWVTFPGPSGWKTWSVDVSAAMAASGTYTVSFSLNLRIETHLATAGTVRIDNVGLMARDYENGTWVSNPLDAGSTAMWDMIARTEALEPETDVRVETRSGASSTPGDATWSTWVGHLVPWGEPIGAPNSRFLQFRVALETLNSSRSPALLDVRIDFAKFPSTGAITTQPFAPGGELIKWRFFNAVDERPSGTGISYEISSNGVSWQSVASSADISGLVGASVVVRAHLATSDTSRTPIIPSMSVTYEFRGPLESIRLRPVSWEGRIGESVQFTHAGFDSWDHPISLVVTWETNDPLGQVTDGMYEPGTAGDWVVRALNADRTIIGEAAVTVLPKPPPSILDQIAWPWSGFGALAAAGAIILVWDLYYRYPHTLEDVFVIARDGRLVAHKTRRLRPDRDEDVFAAMLAAIAAFVRDSFKEEKQELRQFSFGDRTVYVERGDFGYVAAIYADAPPWVRGDLAAFVEDLERANGDLLRTWSGDRDQVSGIAAMTEAFATRRRYVLPWGRMRRQGRSQASGHPVGRKRAS